MESYAAPLYSRIWILTVCHGRSDHKYHLRRMFTVNIFIVHADPVVAAQSLCDKHVVKMPLETAQMLCSVWHRYGYGDKVPYKEAYKNNPCTVWAGDKNPNYNWLWRHGMALCKEYTKRYSKVHKCQQVIEAVKPFTRIWLLPFIMDNEESRFIAHPQCMPYEYKAANNPIEAYRNYYRGAKAKFARWDKGTPAPDWWNVQTTN